ncbi:alpha/beta hydrolase [Actinoplanes flavus]|uniref:Alpha/beta hydrolase n=1 Tax=Actinoplanes flavus TaxID=2820290 RepID=A0ABS3UIT1_9ACTN|nr:alpha/beta hydrolase [Actinoplanes flavus]MBO3738688.1 alpha/beta hydrolase [Actinoplanes flavus]
MITGILVPGRGYTTQGPLFDLADGILTARGDDVVEVSWTVPDGLLQVGPEPFVRAHVAAALHRAAAGTPVLIAKSLGSHAAALAAERGIPAVWLTPVLTDPAVVAAIAAGPAPALLIGGTADRVWLPEAARATGKPCLEIPGADHNLRVPGPVRAYTDVLGTVGTAIEDFLETL